MANYTRVPVPVRHQIPSQKKPKDKRSGFLMGFFMGPLTFLFSSDKEGSMSNGRIIAGWLCGWFALTILIAGVVGVRGEIRQRCEKREMEARAAKERAAAEAEMRHREEQTREKQREERERQKEEKRRDALFAAKDAQSKNLDLRNRINDILNGREYSGFRGSDLRFLDTQEESTEQKGILFPIDTGASEENLAKIRKAIESDTERLSKRHSRFASELKKKKDADNAKILAARKTCESCKGSGGVRVNSKCENCSGSGKVGGESVECKKCSGEGQVEFTVTCRVCKGSGSGRNSCYYCKGKGRVKCEECSGKGGRYVSSYKRGLNGSNLAMRKQFERCQTCHGGGHVKCTSCESTSCRTCGGRGVVSQYQECRVCAGKGSYVAQQACQRCEAGVITSSIQCSECKGRGWTSPYE